MLHKLFVLVCNLLLSITLQRDRLFLTQYQTSLSKNIFEKKCYYRRGYKLVLQKTWLVYWILGLRDNGSQL